MRTRAGGEHGNVCSRGTHEGVGSRGTHEGVGSWGCGRAHIVMRCSMRTRAGGEHGNMCSRGAHAGSRGTHQRLHYARLEQLLACLAQALCRGRHVRVDETLKEPAADWWRVSRGTHVGSRGTHVGSRRCGRAHVVMRCSMRTRAGGEHGNVCSRGTHVGSRGMHEGVGSRG